MTAKVIPLSARAEPREVGALSDEALLAACATGDREALGLLYDRHQVIVWRFIGRLLGPGSSEVDDIVQGTFVEVWRSAARFSGRSTVRTWILGIAHNLARKDMRSRGRRRAALDALARHTEPPPSPEGRLHDRIMLERLQLALQALSPELRATFVLCEVEGVRGVEAAQILGVRPGTVWRRLHDARRRLRRALEGGRP